ncbi:MAG: hypothetical protein QXD49_01200 [Archaeoglobaceae archaeon]|uniref:Uncharacterized protein n=1 Tax=Archaeoglobus fulgidus TaxID=2234 RepID=A0A7J3M546_ARCFL
MDAEKVANALNSRKTAVLGEKISVFGISKELAEELSNLIRFIVDEEEFSGYAVVNGETLVFRKKNEKTILAFVDDEKVMGSIRKLMEL